MDKDYDTDCNNSLCLTIYSLSKEIGRIHRLLLSDLGITYTQYLILIQLWKRQSCTMKELGKYLNLDSGTLTPTINRLVASGYILKERLITDERVVTISLTNAGQTLNEKACKIPALFIEKCGLTKEQLVKMNIDLSLLLHKLQQTR